MLVRGIRYPWLRIRCGLVEPGNPRLGDLSHGETVPSSLHDVQQGGSKNLEGKKKIMMLNSHANEKKVRDFSIFTSASSEATRYNHILPDHS